MDFLDNTFVKVAIAIFYFGFRYYTGNNNEGQDNLSTPASDDTKSLLPVQKNTVIPIKQHHATTPPILNNPLLAGEKMDQQAPRKSPKNREKPDIPIRQQKRKKILNKYQGLKKVMVMQEIFQTKFERTLQRSQSILRKY